MHKIVELKKKKRNIIRIQEKLYIEKYMRFIDYDNFIYVRKPTHLKYK